MIKIMLSAGAVAAVLSLSGHALAQDLTQDHAQAAVVRIGPVDYGNPAQVQAVYAHIREAAMVACQNQSPDNPLFVGPPDRRCIDGVVAQAVGKINRPQLTALYDDRSTDQPRSVLAGNDQ